MNHGLLLQPPVLPAAIGRRSAVTALLVLLALAALLGRIDADGSSMEPARPASPVTGVSATTVPPSCGAGSVGCRP